MMMECGNAMMNIPVIMDIPTTGGDIILQNLVYTPILPTKAINLAVPLKEAVPVLVPDQKEDMGDNAERS